VKDVHASIYLDLQASGSLEDTAFPDDPLGAQSKCSAVSLICRWRLAEFRSDNSINARLRSIRDEVYSRDANAQPLSRKRGNQSSAQVCIQPAQQAPKRSRPGTFVGLGSVAPGRKKGYQEWLQTRAVSQNFADDKKGHMRFIFDVYCELGPLGNLWMTTSSPEEDSTRTSIFLRSLEKYKEDLGPKISAFKRWAEWCLEEGVDHFQPSVVQVGSFLMYKRASGATAASGARNMMEWWRVHVGVPLPSNHPALDSFKR
jgi:hypothetical protein